MNSRIFAKFEKSPLAAIGQYGSLVFCHHELAPQSRKLGPLLAVSGGRLATNSRPLNLIGTHVPLWIAFT